MGLRLHGRIDRPWRFFAIAIVLVIGALFVADWLAFQESTRQADLARRFIRETNSVLSLAKDAEGAQRGYLLTSESKYLGPYQTAVQTFPQALEALAATARLAGRNEREIARIGSLIRQHLGELQQAIDARNNRSVSAVAATLPAGDDKLTMDEVRGACAALVSAESIRLYERTRNAETQADRSRAVVLAGCLTLVFLLFRLGAATDAVVHQREQFGRSAEESRQLLHTTLASIADGVIVTDAEGGVRFMNPVAESLTGWTVSSASTHPLYEVFRLIDEQTREPREDPFDVIARQGTATVLPKHTALISRSGHDIPVEDSSAPIRDSRGRLLGAVIIFRDTTARRAIERELERWKDLFSGAGFGIFVIDPVNCRIVDLNPTFAAMHGYSADQLLNERLDKLSPAGLRGSLAENVRIAREKGRHMWEQEHLRGNGTKFTALVDMTAFEDAGRQYQAGYCSDVTARKHYEDLIRESEERFRTLANALPQLIFSTDSKGSVEYVNNAFTSYSEWQQNSAGEPRELWKDLLHKDDEGAHCERWKQALGSGESFESQVRLKRAKDGSHRWFLCRAVAVRDSSQTVIRWLGTCTDVQDQIESATQLRHTNQALQRSNADLEEFAYAASHDLQEPLRMVSIYSELLKEEYGDQLDRQASSYLDFAVNGAHRMSTLLKALLTYARAADVGLKVGPATAGTVMNGEPDVEATAAVNSALLNLAGVIREAEAKVECGNLPAVAVPEPHLVQLFQNLIGNAVKYRRQNDPGGERLCIRIEAAAAEAGTWLFSVRDNGMGIEPQYLTQIFGLFKRLHGQEFEGAGIGLALCQKIVERTGGRIWVQSTPREGSTFFFTLPAAVKRSDRAA